MSSLTVRPLRFDGYVPHPDDAADVARLYREHETVVLGSVDTTAADIGGYLEVPDVDHARTVLVLEEGEAVGFAYVSTDPDGKDVYVDISGRAGDADVLGLCVRHGVEAAREIVVGLGEPGWTLRTTNWSTDDVLHGLCEEAGLERVRRFYGMRIDSSSPDIPATAPELPDGVEIVVRDDDETRRRIWAVDNDSFLGHWNFTPWPYDRWWDHFSAGSTRDPDGWWLVTVDGEDAALCLLDESRAELGDGYVGVLGVRKQFRGRGIASLLLQRAFVRYRDMGRSGTALGVDAENTAGAVGVYERVGMRPVRVRQGWALPLS